MRVWPLCEVVAMPDCIRLNNDYVGGGAIERPRPRTILLTAVLNYSAADI